MKMMNMMEMPFQDYAICYWKQGATVSFNYLFTQGFMDAMIERASTHTQSRHDWRD